MNISINIKTIAILLPVLLLLSVPASGEEPKGKPAGSAAAKEQAPAKKKNDIAWYLKAGDRNPKWNDLVEPGFSSFDSGAYPTASVFLKKAYDLGCRDGLLLYRLGLYQESLKNYKEAAELLLLAAERIPKQYPSHPMAKGIHEHAARALYQANDIARALPEFQAALAVTPDNFMLLFMAGQILLTQKKYEEARPLFERALTVKPPEGLEIDPQQRVWRELMKITWEMKDYESCGAYAELILAANPTDPVALSYKQQLERAKYQQKEREIIKKMVQ